MFWKKKKSRTFTAEELQAMGISVLVPHTIDLKRVDVKRIDAKRAYPSTAKTEHSKV